MTLSFTLEDGLFVAEFEATSRFNLHLERPASGSIYMKQKTVKDGSYVIVKDFGWNRDGDLIIDADCGQGAVYPKWIRIESAVEPSVAEVTFEDEQSGGGAGTESTMEYLDVSGVDYGIALCALYSYQNKILVQDGEAISISSSVRDYTQTYIACSICFSDTVVNAGKKTTILEELKSMSITEEMLAAIPRITKEQFYNLEA